MPPGPMQMEPNMMEIDIKMMPAEAHRWRDVPQEKRSSRRRNGQSLHGLESVEEVVPLSIGVNDGTKLLPASGHSTNFAVVKGKRTPAKKKKRKVIKSKCLEFSCNYQGCGMSFPKDDQLYSHHAANHDKKKPFICHYGTCVKNFTERNKLRRHFLTHTGERPFACPVLDCGKTFSLDFNLRSHMKTHTGEYVSCPYAGCKKRYTHKYKLRVHIEKDHEDAAPQLIGKGNSKGKDGTTEDGAKVRKRSPQKKSDAEEVVPMASLNGVLEPVVSVAMLRPKREKSIPKRHADFKKEGTKAEGERLVNGHRSFSTGMDDRGRGPASRNEQPDDEVKDGLACQLEAKRHKLEQERQVAERERKSLWQAWEEKTREVERIDMALAELSEEHDRLDDERGRESQAASMHAADEDAWDHVEAQLSMHCEMIHEDEARLLSGACPRDISQQMCMGYRGQSRLQRGECHGHGDTEEPVDFQHSDVLFYTADERERKVQEEERFLIRSPKREHLGRHTIKKEEVDAEENENHGFWKEEERIEQQVGLVSNLYMERSLNDRYDAERDRCMLISNMLVDQHGDSNIKLEHHSLGLGYGGQILANAAW
eukprot:TRINITY_DN7017_c0_g2_i1.p1 TRINITY_DN7017_c0_g2~~TRINITY_DN7017_c0_g2_i1.p1  ORF type:complete len:596 (-),score=133.13 TRINITY_DN7017_c0_g2_i1:82-1869(-)